MHVTLIWTTEEVSITEVPHFNEHLPGGAYLYNELSCNFITVMLSDIRHPLFHILRWCIINKNTSPSTINNSRVLPLQCFLQKLINKIHRNAPLIEILHLSGIDYIRGNLFCFCFFKIFIEEDIKLYMKFKMTYKVINICQNLTPNWGDFQIPLIRGLNNKQLVGIVGMINLGCNGKRNHGNLLS